jgi:hypothetical protein
VGTSSTNLSRDNRPRLGSRTGEQLFAMPAEMLTVLTQVSLPFVSNELASTGRRSNAPRHLSKACRRVKCASNCGRIGSAEPLRSRRCRHRSSGLAMIELPGLIESGMPTRNSQRKPGTTGGSPRRYRTAKTLRLICSAVKSRCARGWGGWRRLSDDGSRRHNSDKNEDPWGGGLPPPPWRHTVARLPTGLSLLAAYTD